MSRTALRVVCSTLFLALGSLGCSPAPSGEDLIHGPPLSTGEICMDVLPATATVSVNGEVMTERCQQYTVSYSSQVEVVITAPGHVTETISAPLTNGSEVLTVRLQSETATPIPPELVEPTNRPPTDIHPDDFPLNGTGE